MVALGYVEADKGNQAFEVALNMRYLVAALYLSARSCSLSAWL